MSSSIVFHLFLAITYFSSIGTRVKATSYFGGSVEACHQTTSTIMTSLRNGVIASNDQCPFEILLGQDLIFSNDSLEVRIESKSTSLKGFLIMGLDTKTDRIVGKFQNTSDKISSAPDCNGMYEVTTASMLRNSTREKYVDTIEWIPPVDYVGDVVFKTMQVQNKSFFLVNQTTKIVSVVRSKRVITTVDPVTKKIVFTDVYEGCGIYKGCVATPNECVASKSCSMLTTYKQVGDHLEMEIYGRISKNKYVATGFSTGGQMMAGGVVECVNHENVPTVYQSFNFHETKNQRLPSQVERFRLLYSAVDYDYIYCQVEHQINYTDSFHLCQQNYYLTMTTREVNKSRHTLKGITSSAINLCASDELSYLTEDSRVLKKLHGSFMVIAWLMGGSIGMLMPRLPIRQILNRKLLGKDLWFVIHRAIMLIVWTMTMIAFILIFVDVGGWISQNAHPIIGCIVTGLAFFQPIMAFLRPEADAPNRYIFNRAHWLVGHLAHLLAHVTIYLAIGLEAAQIPVEMYWVLSAHLAVYIAMQSLMIYLARKPLLRAVVDSVKGDDSCRVNCWGPTGTKIMLAIFISIILVLGTTMVLLISVG